MSITTKTGDAGTTGLMFNRRVSKGDPRVEAYGTVDELNAALGLARSFNEEPAIAQELFALQKELVMVMGELATLPEDHARYVAKGFSLVSEAMHQRIEARIREIESGGITYEGWDTPGATPMAGALHLARTICRRAEREMFRLEPESPTNLHLIIYLNRLSDLLFLFARLVEMARAPQPNRADPEKR
jgi:cob(I)alamin adenosyltransferase